MAFALEPPTSVLMRGPKTSPVRWSRRRGVRVAQFKASLMQHCSTRVSFVCDRVRCDRGCY